MFYPPIMALFVDLMHTSLRFRSRVIRAAQVDKTTTRSIEFLVCFKDRKLVMANHKSAEKRVRQNENETRSTAATAVNCGRRSKSCAATLTAHDKPGSQELLNPTVSLIDKAVNKGIIQEIRLPVTSRV